MEAIGTNSYYVVIPKVDATLFRSMAKRMGWNICKEKKYTQQDLNATTIQAIKDVEDGKTFKANSAKELIEILNS